MSKVLIYADYLKRDDEDRLILTCRGTLIDLERHGIKLQEGLALTFYMDDADDFGNADDLLVNGVVFYDQIKNRWVALIDETTFRHLSDDPTAEVKPASN